MPEARPLVVLLPPLGFDRGVYTSVARALEPFATVRTFDYPGFDDSDASLSPAPGLLEDLAARFVRTFRDEGLRPAILGGISIGGTLSILMKDEVNPAALLLMAPGGLKVANVRREAVLAAMNDAEPIAFARRSLGLDGDAYEDAGLASHFPAHPELGREAFAQLRETVWAPAVEARRAATYGALLRAAVDVDLTPRLTANEVPTDLVWGERDRVFPLRIAHRYAETMTRATFHGLPGVGHFAAAEEPDAIARIVRARLEQEGALRA